MHCVCVFEVKEVRGGNNDNGKIPHNWYGEKTSVPIHVEEGKHKQSEEKLKEHFKEQYATLNLLMCYWYILMVFLCVIKQMLTHTK